MQRQSYQVKTVLEQKDARRKTFLLLKGSLRNPLGRSPIAIQLRGEINVTHVTVSGKRSVVSRRISRPPSPHPRRRRNLGTNQCDTNMDPHILHRVEQKGIGQAAKKTHNKIFRIFCSRRKASFKYTGLCERRKADKK